jgi:hypothetical protein
VKSIGLSGLVNKARRFITQPASVQDDVTKDPGKLSETLRQMTQRLNKLEAASPPEATEFEIVCGQGGSLVELFHNFKGPVRWYVVAWLNTDNVAYPHLGPQLAQDASSTPTSLFLRSYSPGRAVVRVEPSQAYLDNGIVIVQKPPLQMLAAQFTTTSATAVDTGLQVSADAGELWLVEYWGYSKCSTVNGTRYAVTAPAGATGTGWLDSSSANFAVANWFYLDLTISTLSAGCHIGANNNFRRDSIVYRVKMGSTPGDIKIQFASVTGGNTSDIALGSGARFTRMTEV